jgi:putative ABC transport system permease protein
MFLTYLGRELRRRARQASIIALGLALGIGLVITVTALSSGVKNAEGEVLHSLYGQDTDITVTKAPKFGSGAAGSFGFRGSFGSTSRPAAGTTIDVDTLRGAGLGTLTSGDLASVARLDNVAAAAGGLSLTDTKITGTIPAVNSSGGSGGGFGGGGSGGGGFRGPGGFNVGNSVSVDGVDLASSAQVLGPLSNATLTTGRTFKSSDASSDVAVIDSSYAKSANLKVGSTVTLASTSFKVVGEVTEPADDSAVDVYIPLARAQALTTPAMTGEVNTIFVAAASSTDVTAVQKEIQKAVPGSTVTTSADLASEVTGSLSSASSLANNLGKWLAIAALIAAFLLASLLTMSAVSRRVREFGTLKALGWRSRRVIGQVMGESIATGIIGGVVGIGLGFLGAFIVSKASPGLTASLGTTTGSATPGGARTFGGFGGGGGGGFGGGFGGGGGAGGSGSGASGGGFAGRFAGAAGRAARSTVVHLGAPITVDIIILAVVLAVAGGLIAGILGGWRAARLRPAAALSRVE